MTRRTCSLVAFTLSLFGRPPLAAQWSYLDSIRTPRGMCRVWESIPGGSSSADSSYARCALDQPPRMLSDPALPQPVHALSVGGEFTIIVNADGSVDQDLTRAWIERVDRYDDSVAYRRTLEQIKTWRFQPGMHNGKAVRSGYRLQLGTDRRNDTLPGRLRWSYRELPQGEDLLEGRWETVVAAQARLTEEQFDSLHAGLFRRLVEMRVVRPSLSQSYCLVFDPNTDAARNRRISAIAERVLASRETSRYMDSQQRVESQCERNPGSLRLFMPRVHLTEGDRVVVSPAGDFLSDWPPGFYSATYPSWSSRCVVTVPAHARASVDCTIEPPYLSAAGRSQWERVPQPKWYIPGDSIRLSVIAMTYGAFQSDTLRAVVHRLPRLSQSALLVSRTECANSWAAYTAQDVGALSVVSGDISDMGTLRITEVYHTAVPRARADRCAASTSRDSVFALFVLGDVGDTVRSPITFCMGNPICTIHHQVDPRKHTLVDRAHVRFRLADLRADTRVGDKAVVRIYVDPVPEGLMPLIVLRRGKRVPDSIWVMRRVGLDCWEFAVNYGPALPAESEFAVYLVAR
jgi:hypothetical protein